MFVDANNGPMYLATPATTIAALQHIFSYFDLPEHIVLDKGYNLQTTSYRNSFQKMISSMLLHFQDIQLLVDWQNAILVNLNTGETLQTKLDRFLLTYCATQTSMRKAPSELLKRQRRTRPSAWRSKTTNQEVKRFQENLDCVARFRANDPVFAIKSGRSTHWVPGLYLK